MNAKPLTQIWTDHHLPFLPVVPFRRGQDRLGWLDLSSANTRLTEAIYSDLGRFSDYILGELARTGSTYLVGGYNELRKIYAASGLFSGDEPRRLHLGVDIWGPAGTPVYAPAGGVIHSVAWNGTQGDYGGTVILRHETETRHDAAPGGDHEPDESRNSAETHEADHLSMTDRVIWHTLYGHLSAASVMDKAEGRRIMAGEAIGMLGVPAENGHWPPHLHFQVILDMQGYKGDYPGVCRYSEREAYLENCPDPAMAAGLGL